MKHDNFTIRGLHVKFVDKKNNEVIYEYNVVSFILRM